QCKPGLGPRLQRCHGSAGRRRSSVAVDGGGRHGGELGDRAVELAAPEHPLASRRGACRGAVGLVRRLTPSRRNMESLSLLIPLSVALVLLIGVVLAWAVLSGRFEDLDAEGRR